MFGVRIGSEYLNIRKGSTISMEINSSIFDDELIQGSFTYQFDMDMSGRNMRLTNFRNIIQNKLRLETPIDCFVDIEGNPYKTAKLRLDYSSRDKMTGYIQIDSGAAAELMNKLKLSDIDLGGLRFIGNTYAAKLAHFNSKAPLLGIVDQYCFFPIYHPNFYGESEDTVNPMYSNTSKIINNFSDGSFLSNPDVFGGGSRLEYSFVPFPSLFYVIKQACKTLGYMATGSLFNDEEMKGAVIYNTMAIDRIAPGIDTAPINFHQDEINLASHVPDITIGEFFHFLRNFFFINITFDAARKTVDFTPLKQIHRSPEYVDWSKGCNRVPEEKAMDTSGLKLTWGVDDEDELFETNQFQREYTEGTTTGDRKEISSDASGLYMITDPLAHPTNKQLVPHALQRGNSLDPEYNDPDVDEKYLGQNSYTFRILFYRGKHQDSSGSLYPLGSSDVFKYDGTRIAHYTTDWLGTYGRRNAWAKEHIYFWNNTKKFTVNKFFTRAELENFDPKKKVMIHGIKGFVSKINIDSDFKTKEAQVELYTA